MSSIECRAKINLYLRVVGKRADGYHEIETLMQEIDWADVLTWRPDDGPLRLSVSGADLGDPEENLVMKAARAFAGCVGISIGGAFELRKRIPAGAGLGGGSADAAGALKLLNRQMGEPLDLTQLHQLAAALGSDIPFFINGGCQLGRGRGERLSPAAAPAGPERGYLLLSGLHLATADVYRRCRPQVGEAASVIGRNDLLAPARLVSPAFDALWRNLAPLMAGEPFFMTGSGSALVWLTDRAAPPQFLRDALPRLGLALWPFRFVG